MPEFPTINYLNSLPACFTMVPMTSLQITPAQLRQAANLKEKIVELERQLASILGTTTMAAPGKPLAARWRAAGLAL